MNDTDILLISHLVHIQATLIVSKWMTINPHYGISTPFELLEYRYHLRKNFANVKLNRSTVYQSKTNNNIREGGVENGRVKNGREYAKPRKYLYHLSIESKSKSLHRWMVRERKRDWERKRNDSFKQTEFIGCGISMPYAISFPHQSGWFPGKYFL